MIRLKHIFDSRGWLILFLVVASFGIFSNILQNGYFFDDAKLVLNNPWIRDVRYLPDIITTHLWGGAQGSTALYYRPMLYIIFMAQYYVFGLASVGFHLGNIIVHALNTVLVFLIALHMFNDLYLGSRPEGAGGIKRTHLAFISALLFSLHPAHVEPVAWVSAMTELSFSLFFLLSLYLYMISRERTYCVQGSDTRARLFFILSVLSYALALFSKETSLTFIAVLVTLDFSKQGFKGLSVKRYLPYVALIIVYSLIRVFLVGTTVPKSEIANMSLYGYAINIVPLVSDYILLFVFPYDLNVFRIFHPVLSITEPKFIVSFIIVTVAVVFLVIKRADKVIFFTLLWAFFSLLPALYIPGVK